MKGAVSCGAVLLMAVHVPCRQDSTLPRDWKDSGWPLMGQSEPRSVRYW
jgi:hypothetical protein